MKGTRYSLGSPDHTHARWKIILTQLVVSLITTLIITAPQRSTKTRPQTNQFFIESVIYLGENLIYKNEGHNTIVKVFSQKVDTNGMLTYKIEFFSDELKEIPREFLSRPNNPDIANFHQTFLKSMKQFVNSVMKTFAS